jgi:hypothetical protein
MTIRLIKQHFLFLFILSIPLVGTASGQVNVHTSAMINGDILKRQPLGYDLTIFLNGKWGLRYSQNSDVQFVNPELEQKDNQLSELSVNGDLKQLTLLRAIDYRTYDRSNSTPLDFLTAYVGVGYSRNKLLLKKKLYRAKTDNLITGDLEDQVPVALYSLSLGLYGGEKHVVVDTQLQYIRGTVSGSELLSKNIIISQWRLILAIGLSY